MNAREKLMKELNDLSMVRTHISWQEFVADFIIEDRKRIVEPLLKYNNFGNIFNNKMEIYERIDQTIKNAGV